jgi:hypothetical protein
MGSTVSRFMQVKQGLSVIDFEMLRRAGIVADALDR